MYMYDDDDVTYRSPGDGADELSVLLVSLALRPLLKHALTAYTYSFTQKLRHHNKTDKERTRSKRGKITQIDGNATS